MLLDTRDAKCVVDGAHTKDEHVVVHLEADRLSSEGRLDHGWGGGRAIGQCFRIDQHSRGSQWVALQALPTLNLDKVWKIGRVYKVYLPIIRGRAEAPSYPPTHASLTWGLSLAGKHQEISPPHASFTACLGSIRHHCPGVRHRGGERDYALHACTAENAPKPQKTEPGATEF